MWFPICDLIKLSSEEKKVELNNAEKVACDFYDWLIEMQYCNTEDKMEDIEDMIKDFIIIQRYAPKLFNLLRNISN